MTDSNQSLNMERKYYPLSLAQQELWLIHQADPESSAYNTGFAVRTKNINFRALKNVLLSILDHHPSLRSIFCIKDREIYQATLPVHQVPIIVTDARDWDEQKLLSEAINVYQKPFNLEETGATRIYMFQTRLDEYVVVLSFHHIIYDDWSSGILIKDIMSFGREDSKGHKASYDEIFPYQKFIEYQTNLIDSSRGTDLKMFWEKELNHRYMPLKLPMQLTNEVKKSYQTAININSHLSETLKSLARSQGTTLSTLLLCAYQMLLYRYSTQEKILVGLPVAGRNHPEFRNIVGYFVNLLPILVDFSDKKDITFKKFLMQMSAKVRSALEYQDFPFLLIKDILLKNQTSSPSSSIIQAAFSFLKKHEINVKPHDSSMNSLADMIEPFDIPSQNDVFEIMLELIEKNNRIVGFIKTKNKMTDQFFLSQFARHYIVLLQNIAANPDEPINMIHILSPEEKYQFSLWNKTKTSLPTCSIIELFEQQAEKTPDAIAVSSDCNALTYKEFNAQVNKISNYLNDKYNIVPGDMIGILGKRSIHFIIAMFSIMKSGGIYIPLDDTLPEERIQLILNETEMSILLAIEKDTEIKFNGGLPIICLDTLIKESVAYNANNAVMKDNGNKVACIFYTSGTSGKPKGIMVTYEAIKRLVKSTNYINILPEDCIAHTASPSFDASTFEIFGALLNGAQCKIISNDILLTPKKFSEFISTNNINILWLTTALFNQLTKAIPSALAPLKYFLVGGEAVSSKMVSSVIKNGKPKHFFIVYGPTENTTFTTKYEITQDLSPEKYVPIGKPISNTEIFILNNQLQQVPIGVIGELYIGGSGLSLGYLNAPGLTEEKFIKSPFNTEALLYKSGDYCRYLPDGNVEFIGRKDNQIKFRGYRIEITEIESVLMNYPSIYEAAVVYKKDENSSGHLVAYISLNEDRDVSSFSERDIKNYILNKLPSYMLPAHIIHLEKMSLNNNAKIDRKYLLSLPIKAIDKNISYIAPKSAVEKSLASIWQEILLVDQVSLHDNFFELGGHSIQAMHIIFHIRELYKVDISMKALLESSNIETLAKLIEKEQAIQKNSDIELIKVERSNYLREES